MKKLLIIIVVLLILTSFVFAQLSDETLEIVNDLRWKHYGHGFLICTDGSLFYDGTIEWTRDYLSISFDSEKGILFVETQDGKWFIEMEKVIE